MDCCWYDLTDIIVMQKTGFYVVLSIMVFLSEMDNIVSVDATIQHYCVEVTYVFFAPLNFEPS